MNPLRKGVNRVAQAAANSKVTNNVITNNVLTRAVATAITTIVSDPHFQQWFAHGANELANGIVKGEAAPIYARSLSPATEGPEVEGTIYGMDQQPEISAPEIGLSQEPSVIESLVANAKEMAPEQEMAPEVDV